MGVLHIQTSTNETPSLRQVFLWSCELEVIYIDHKEEAERGVPVAGAPAVVYWFEAHGPKVAVTVLLPIPATVGVPV